MRTYEVWQVDAFTDRALTGNACAVVLDARGLDDTTMLAIAREMNLSETAYVFPSDDADFGVRYFTPIAEIPLAGHPTIATTHALREQGRIPALRERTTLHMPAGVIPVRIERTDGGRYRYTMSQPAPQFLSMHDTKKIAAAIGVDRKEIVEPVQTVSTGTAQQMIALRDRATLDALRVDRAKLFPAERDFFSVHLFARGNDAHALHARHFAPFGDIVEDPFTGSATGGMAAWAARYGFVAETTYTVAQGMHVHRPGVGTVRVLGNPPEQIEGVEVGGEAVTVMKGVITIP